MSRKDKNLKVYKRPFATYYYSDIRAKESAYTTQGHAASDKGAIRASIVRIFVEQHAMAVIYDRNSGIVVYTVKRGATGISVHYGRSGQPHLALVK